MPGDFIPAGPYVPEGGAAALVADAINDGTTTVAPSQNAVFDALAVKLSTTGGGKDTVSNLGSLTGTIGIDLANGNSFYGTLTGNTTFTMAGFTNAKECEFVLGIVQDSTPRSITWPAAVKWAGGTPPTISTASGARDVFVFRSRDGGTTIDGILVGKAFA